MKKTISILGSTGSIGLNTLDIIKKNKKLFKVNILLANKNFKLICDQIVKYNPNIFIINDFTTFLKIKKKFKRRKNIIIVNNLDILKKK